MDEKKIKYNMTRMEGMTNITGISIINNFTNNSLDYSFNNTLEMSIEVESNSTTDQNEVVITTEQILTLILPYTLIFFLAIIGNALVIITLGANRRMRSVTNMFLLNLAVSDLLLGVFCMPFTLVGVLLKQFIFGSVMCSLISYLQAVSVGVSVWTLVVMSWERYYAICHPLKSRECRQTLSHAYKMIALVWISSLLTMSPIAFVSELKPIENSGNPGKYKCRESWPQQLGRHGFEVFTIFLDFILLILPLIIMSVTYSMIALTLKNNLRSHSSGNNDQNTRRANLSDVSHSTGNSISDTNGNQCTAFTNGTKTRLNNDANDSGIETQVLTPVTTRDRPRVTALRSNADPIAAEAKQRRVIKMLFVVVLEFFICWTPIYTINTITLYNPRIVYQGLGYNGISFFHLLAFFSSCTNPITYCFMNSKFRQSFLLLFRCKHTRHDFTTSTTGGTSSHTTRSSAKSINSRSQRYKFT